MSKRAATLDPDAERASIKQKTEDPKCHTEFDAAFMTAWLDEWMKTHVYSQTPTDFANLLSVETQLELLDNFGTFTEDLKEDHKITFGDEDALKKKLFEVEVDYLHASTLNDFLTTQFKLNFKNRVRVDEFHERLEESGTVDQLQFDVLYDFATYIGSNGHEDTNESDSDEEPVEEEESEESGESEESEESGESGEESGSESEESGE